MGGIELETISIKTLFTALVFLLITSAFFSSSETGIMSLNRYRLKNAARHKRTARCIATLLARPDRLLAVILIGNNFINLSASAIATIIGIRLMGDIGVLVATVILTITILIFSEIAPKTLAAINPEKIAYPSAYPLKFLLIVLYPLVLAANSLSNSLLWLLGTRKIKRHHDSLSLEELRTLVSESTLIMSNRNQEMLSQILELERMSVNDIMIPKTEIVGIDINNDKTTIADQLSKTNHTLLPVFKDNINNILGFVHVREVMRLFIQDHFSIKKLRSILHQPYFVPERAPLDTQLINFQRQKKRIALVVDEYGDIIGLITVEDILEEIVGEFTTDVAAIANEITPQPDGSYLINGSASIRAINRTMGWNLPNFGAQTLSGAITEYLEAIPQSDTGVKLGNYKIEIIKIQDNIIKTVKIFPK